MDDRLSKKVTKQLKVLSTEKGTTFNRQKTEYLLECLAKRLSSNKDLTNNIIFKGGTIFSPFYISTRYFKIFAKNTIYLITQLEKIPTD